MPNLDDAKNALDKIIKKGRVHLYKPIQIAEILYYDREVRTLNLADKEEYRTQSRKWRDNISDVLVGSHSTSSSIYQDNIFDDNAMPPVLLELLGEENRAKSGVVEAYIYRLILGRHRQLVNALNVCLQSDRDSFQVKDFIDSFWHSPGLKRSLDKIYEIIVYALFSTITETLDMKVELSIDSSKLDILEEFKDFSKKVLCIDVNNMSYTQDAKVFRVGVTNAADRGLDMYSNWGPAIQIKHLSLDEELAKDIVGSVSSDRIVIVCKDAEKNVILSLLTQIGWKSKIQSIVTESELINWYEKALRGKYADIMGDNLLERLTEEIIKEFPSTLHYPEELERRNYDSISADDYWADWDE